MTLEIEQAVGLTIAAVIGLVGLALVLWGLLTQQPTQPTTKDAGPQTTKPNEETSLAAACIRRAVLGEELDEADTQAAIQLHKDLLTGVREVRRVERNGG